jgi:hypothetical protein
LFTVAFLLSIISLFSPFYVFLCCLLTLSLVFLVYSFLFSCFLAYDISICLFEAGRFFFPVQRHLFEIFT